MGIASQLHYLLHRVRVAHAVPLGQYPQPPCQLSRFVCTGIPALQLHSSRIGYALGDGLDQRGFSHAVRPHKHQPLPLLQREGKIVHGRMAAVADGDVFHFQHIRHPAFLEW